jgi:hypothetical protein
MNACWGVAITLSLKRASTKVMDTMTNMMSMVPDLVIDWQESSARGAADCALIMCKAHFLDMDLVHIARGVPKATNIKKLISEVSGFDSLFASRVNHEEWYEKHDFPAGFAQEDEEDAEEGTGASASQYGSESGKDNTYSASEDDKSESSG